MSQRALAELFAVGVPAINKHLKNIFESRELNEKGTISKMETVQLEGSREVRRTVDFYNLDAIIATACSQIVQQAVAHLPESVLEPIPSNGRRIDKKESAPCPVERKSQDRSPPVIPSRVSNELEAGQGISFGNHPTCRLKP